MKVSSPDGIKVNNVDSKEEFGTHAEPFFSFLSTASIDIPKTHRSFSLALPQNHLSQVYNVSSGKSTPQWLSGSKKRALRKDEEYR